jgi:hypothetical protein
MLGMCAYEDVMEVIMIVYLHVQRDTMLYVMHCILCVVNIVSIRMFNV